MRKLAVTFIALIGAVLLVGLVGCGKATLSITTTSLPNGEVNIAYSRTLEASGGSGNYTIWSILSGTLPAGLSFVPLFGLLSGTPTTVGTDNFTVQVTDSSGSTRSENLSITIAAAPSITTTSLPDGTVGTAYSQTPVASGGSGTYRWSGAPDSDSPPPLPLDSSTGVISGTPTTAGAFGFIVEVTDSLGGTATRGLGLTVHAAG